MSLIEQVRSEVVRHTLDLPSFQGSWAARRDIIRGTFGNPDAPTRAELVQLGEHLSDIFQCIGRGQRTNADVSGGGVAWSALVSWYLNLCYAGTDAIAFREGRGAPDCMKDAMSINYQNTNLRASDTDVLVISLPGFQQQADEPHARNVAQRLEDYFAGNFGRSGMVNIQCKTTWNDNAQIPMLWNMIFQQARLGNAPHGGFLVGQRGYHLSNLGYFAYAFASVPTVTGGEAGIRPGSMPVLRVAALSGGAFWGHPSRGNVCRSLSEFFGHQYGGGAAVMPNVNLMGQGYLDAVAGNAPHVDYQAFGLV